MYLDRSTHGITSDEVSYNEAEGYIEITGCVAWAIHNVGDVAVTIGNGIVIAAGSYYSDCGSCCLDFVVNKPYQFASGAGNKNILLVRTKVVPKEGCAV